MSPQDFEIELTQDPHDPRVGHLSIKADGGFLKGEIAHSSIIAERFGSTSNPARYNLLQSLEGQAAWLFEIKIPRDQRGRGRGTDLMHAALGVFLQHGVQYVILSPRAETPEDGERLIRFYERLGFQEVRQFEGENLWFPLMVSELKR